MPQKRILTEHESRFARLGAAIASAKHLHEGACEDERVRSVTYCSCFWKLVFVGYHGEEPEGDNDKRWDHLFAEGFPILRLLDGSHP
jgi:hypothetical protein